MWPGYGENSRVLAWIVARLEGRVEARETPLGFTPFPGDLESEGLDLSDEDLEKLFSINLEELQDEAEDISRHYQQFGEDLPKELSDQLELLRSATSK